MGEIFGALYLLCMTFCAGYLFQYALSEDRNWFEKLVYCLVALLFVVPLAPFFPGHQWAWNNAGRLNRLESLDERLYAISRKLYDRT